MKPIVAILAGAALALGSCDSLGVRVLDYFDETTVAPLVSNGGLDDAGADLLDRNLDGVSVLMTGEAHGSAESIEIALLLARHLAEGGRPTTLLWEVGFAAGVYLDEYLAGGQAATLDEIIAASEGTYLFTREWRDFYRAIRELNASRPAADRIRLLGVDIEHQYGRGLSLMQESLPDAPVGSAPSQIAAVVGDLVGWSPANASEPADNDLSAAISGSLEEHASAWKGYLDTAFDRFRIAAVSVRSRFECYATSEDRFARAREAAIERIFLEADSWHRARTAPTDPFYYGHWGRVHIRRAPADGVDWIAGRIESTPGYAGAVLSAKLFYHESLALRRNPYRVAPLADPPIAVGLLARSSTGPVTLYDLDEPGSPFLDRPELVASPDAGGATTDYFQLAVLVRGGSAAVPLSR
ncbi:MAG: hypothetical protein ACOC7V_11295 [Spirochaetota bacterium]